MTDELVEKVARAICEMDALAYGDDLVEAAVDHYWRNNVPHARAALTAIEAAGWAVVPKEPTYQMLADADTAIPRFEADENGHRMMGVDGAELCWNTMLSARPPIGGESNG